MTAAPELASLTLPPARDLRPLFFPTSIAVVGASRKVGSVGHAVIRNLIYGHYTGVIYPVNPQAKGILGVPCFKDLQSLGEVPDLVVVVVPSPHVERVVLQAAELGTKHMVVISAGFKEVGEEGAVRELRIRDIARERGLSILGPNCLGVINTDPEVQMNASFGRDIPPHGCLGLISQSGALCAALLDYAKGRGIGFSQFVSFGNKCDIDEVDLLRSLAADDKTQAIMMYVEEIGDGHRFLAAAHEITHGTNPKPILVIKSGRTAEGAAAAASHTGSLAGSDELYNALDDPGGRVPRRNGGRVVRSGRSLHRSDVAGRSQDRDRHQRRRAGHHGDRRRHPQRLGVGQVPRLHQEVAPVPDAHRGQHQESRRRDRGRPQRSLPRGLGCGDRR